MNPTPDHSNELRLLSPRLLLRPLRRPDVERVVAYRSDPLVARYQSWDVPYTVSQAHSLLEEARHLPVGTRGVWCQLGLELRSTRELVGDIGFRVLADDTAQAEIGFTLAIAHQGQGYASEAALRLLRYMFEDLELHRVRAMCAAENEASARLLKRVGMRLEGHCKQASFFKGKWTDDLWFAQLRQEWQSGQSGQDVSDIR